MANANLLDIAKLNGTDDVVGLIEQNLSFVPEIGIFPVRTIRGTSYRTVTRTAYPTTAFRAANEGITASKSSLTNTLVECFILGGAINVDLAVARAHEDGQQAYEDLESSGVMRSALITLATQIWYGTTADAKGFPGIKAAVPKGSTISLDLTGATATSQSSVYGVKFSTQDVHIITGNNTTFELPPFMDQQLLDSNSKPYAGRVSNLTAWCGLQIGNINCVGRILNIDPSTAGKMLTDAFLSQLLAKFPVGYWPDAWFMSRRSAGQLQRSRTVTIQGGPGNAQATGNVAAIAPWPESAFGIPIVITDAILDTDAVE